MHNFYLCLLNLKFIPTPQTSQFGMDRMEKLELNRQQFGHLRPTKLNSGRLPTTPMKLEQIQAEDESIMKYDPQIAKLSHLRLKTQQNNEIGAELRN